MGDSLRQVEIFSDAVGEEFLGEQGLGELDPGGAGADGIAEVGGAGFDDF